MSDLEEESFSSTKDASLHRAVMAEERVKHEKSSGLVYAGSIILLYASLIPELSWHILIFMWCLYLPIRDIYRATKEQDKMYKKYVEICAENDGK